MDEHEETVAEYVWIPDRRSWGAPVSDGEHEQLCSLAERWLTEHEGDLRSITVRPARFRETPGLYARKANGDLQILGYSSASSAFVARPEDVDRLLDEAHQHAREAAEANEEG